MLGVRKTIHVTPHIAGWQLLHGNSPEAGGLFPRREEAIDAAVTLASTFRPCEVRVHGTDGCVHETRLVD